MLLHQVTIKLIMFKTIIKKELDSQIDWAIDNLIELFAKADMDNILEN